MTARIITMFDYEKSRIEREETLSFIAEKQNRQQIGHIHCNGCITITMVMITVMMVVKN
jgi:hypothetical protein